MALIRGRGKTCDCPLCACYLREPRGNTLALEHEQLRAASLRSIRSIRDLVHLLRRFRSLPNVCHNATRSELLLSLIHISEPTRLLSISYAVFCLKKNNKQQTTVHLVERDPDQTEQAAETSAA